MMAWYGHLYGHNETVNYCGGKWEECFDILGMSAILTQLEL